jgi:uncharacterized protein (DUF1697 family)
MPAYAAFIRALNVGGTGKLPMAELKALCEGCGLTDVKTYIQSGNVVFKSRRGAGAVRDALQAAIAQRLGKTHEVFVRTPAQVRTLTTDSPFPAAAPNRLHVYFLDEAPSEAALASVKHRTTEEIHLAGSEAYVHYPDGMGTSKLSLPFAKNGTARNMNTIVQVLGMLDALK